MLMKDVHIHAFKTLISWFLMSIYENYIMAKQSED